ncbi:hypothetical protein B1218_38460 [Pseudomonas ogarae]|nr:hypothetical protein B1218_38460 [Pseudomonas ogarae]
MGRGGEYPSGGVGGGGGKWGIPRRQCGAGTERRKGGAEGAAQAVGRVSGEDAWKGREVAVCTGKRWPAWRAGLAGQW